ncbi:hypothetical protein GN958_ATG20838 [Phytophthora infestans]|uniref:Bzip transcription factor n=1 Tax=Phytophthora infestans TaxID=4787 RepID=A0A8S9TLV6_PHYIN|nr:hypothetical protein GN958_ATG20838 [Phytophthora infestans]
MHLSTLHPPNSHQLRDDVVTGAVICVRRANRLHFGTSAHQITRSEQVGGNLSCRWEDNGAFSEKPARTPASRGKSSLINVTKKNSESTRATSFKHLKTASQDDKYKAIAELLELSERVQRERRREVQQRYRMKQKHLTDSLDKDIRELQHKIKTLAKQRLVVPGSVPAANNVWELAVRYFRLVRLGFQPSDLFDAMRDAMAPDVVYNTECGFKAVVRGWCFMNWFDDVEVELEHLSKSAGNSMIVTTITSVTITQRTLANVFPHLLNSKNEDTLASKLRGQRITMRGSTCFKWNAVTKRVVSVMAQSDMLTPMLRLLGSLENVSQVFDKVCISPSFQWRYIRNNKFGVRAKDSAARLLLS